MGAVLWLAACETMRAALFVVVFSFSSFTDGRHGEGAGIVVGPRALVVFSGFAALICAVVLTDIPVVFLGSLTTYEVIPLFDSSPTRWGIHVTVIVGHGAPILRPACNAVRVAICSIVAASCLTASCLLYALMWASCWWGLVGARIDEVDNFLGEGVVLLL